MTEPPRRIIPVIVISQFAGTTLWFAGNAILPDLQKQWNLGPEAIGMITSAVQLGFIVGTFCFAFFAVSDRFSPRLLFLVSSLLGAAFNLLTLSTSELNAFLVLRFLTGCCLAGVYPVGMKIAAGWYREGLGNAIGFLVGALVLGTAFPHLLKGLDQTFPWQDVTISVSAIAASGGLLMALFIQDGPRLSANSAFTLQAIPAVFSSREFRLAAFGYFGHMWELYTFWAFTPMLLQIYASFHGMELNVPFWTFLIITAGSFGSVGGGIVSKKVGSARVAFSLLLISGLCCLVSPLVIHAPPEIFLSFLVLWGITVVGDSPQFSALAANDAPPQYVGSALTIMNSIGFAITIVSIQLMSWLAPQVGVQNVFLLLAIGPVLGLGSLWPLVSTNRAR